MEITSKFFAVFYLLAGGQGLFLWFLLHTRKKGNEQHTHRWLGLLVGGISLQLFAYSLAYGEVLLTYPHLWGLTHAFPFLYGPLVYLYMQALTEPVSKRSPAIMMLHFAPAVLYVLLNTGFYLVDAETKRTLMQAAIYSEQGVVLGVKAKVFSILMILHLSGYLLVLWRKLRVRPVSENPLHQNQWTKSVIYGFGMYVLFFVIYKAALVLEVPFKDMICHSTKVAMAASIYTIGYLGFSQPDTLFNLFKKVRKTTPCIPDTILSGIEHRMEEVMRTTRPYLEEGFNQQKLAELLGTNAQYISKTVNSRLDMSFSEYIQSYRVKEAQRLLQQYPEKKILAVAFESGFSSKVTFNVVFKKIVGMSPSAYRNQFRDQKEVSIYKSERI